MADPVSVAHSFDGENASKPVSPEENASTAQCIASTTTTTTSLPSARELSKILCPIIDDTRYTTEDSRLTLETLNQYALWKDVRFEKDFVDVGGLRQVLFFLEDRSNNATEIAPALQLLRTLCQHTGESSRIIETSVVDMDGVEILLRIFRSHALVDADDSSLETALTAMDCYLGCGGASAPQPCPNDSGASLDLAKQAMEVLFLLIPCVTTTTTNNNNNKKETAPTTILETIGNGLSTLLEEGNTFSYTRQRLASFEELIATVFSCLVATLSVASKETLSQNDRLVAKQLVSVTNRAMKTFEEHPSINRDGCLVLQAAGRHLLKAERKRLGVIAALGSVVASSSIDVETKILADEILEQQFQ